MNTQDTEGRRGRSIVLIRHGETDANVAGRFVGSSDPPLNAQGERRAAALAAAVAAFAADRVVTSPLARARRTAQLATGQRPDIEVDDRLREVDFGAWEGVPDSEVRCIDPEGYARFSSGTFSRFPGGEAVLDAAARMVAAVTDRNEPRVLLVSHATMIRLVVVSLLGLDPQRYRRVLARPDSCSWTQFEETSSGWRLVAYNREVAGG